MDGELASFLANAKQRSGKKFPNFSKEALHTAPLLSLLQDPGKSGALSSGECSLKNNDPTAKRMARVLGDLKIDSSDVVFWNFCGAYDGSYRDFRYWAGEVEELIRVLPNLRGIVISGQVAWLGMRYVQVPDGITLFWSPHPSNRSVNSNPRAETEICQAWKRAKALLG